jgi:hypothetical protein
MAFLSNWGQTQVGFAGVKEPTKWYPYGIPK